MQRPFPGLWVLLLGLLVLAPGPAGRLLLDLLGGLTLTLLLLPLLLAGVGVIAWKVLQSRLRTCPACGLSSLGTEQCPACGTSSAEPPRAALLRQRRRSTPPTSRLMWWLKRCWIPTQTAELKQPPLP